MGREREMMSHGSITQGEVRSEVAWVDSGSSRKVRSGKIEKSNELAEGVRGRVARGSVRWEVACVDSGTLRNIRPQGSGTSRNVRPQEKLEAE